MVELIRKDVSANNGGELSTGTQTIPGNKTWSGTQAFTGATSFTSPLVGVSLGNEIPNLIINGGMDFFQRSVGPLAAPSTEYVSGYFVADRFSTRNEVASGAANTLRVSDAPSTSLSGHSLNYCLEVDITTAKVTLTGGDNLRIKYIVEGHDAASFNRRGCRIQFFVKSNKLGTYTLQLSNSGGNRVYIASYTISVADTWEQKVFNIPAETTGTWNTTTGEGLNITWNLGSVSFQSGNLNEWKASGNGAHPSQANLMDNVNNYFRLTGVALYPGDFSNITDAFTFRRAGRTISDELRMCQRYYEKSYEQGVNPGTSSTLGITWTNMAGTTSANRRLWIPYKVTKRITPSTVSFWDQAGNPGQYTSEDTAGSGTNNAGAISEAVRSAESFIAGWGPTTAPGIRVHWAVDTEL